MSPHQFPHLIFSLCLADLEQQKNKDLQQKWGQIRHKCYYVIRTAWLLEDFKRSICFAYCGWVATQRAGIHFILCHVQSERGGGGIFLFLVSSFLFPSRKLHSRAETDLFLNNACSFCFSEGSRVLPYPSLGHFLHFSQEKICQSENQTVCAQPGDRRPGCPALYRKKKKD